MIVIFDIEKSGDLTPTMVAHKVGNLIKLPFEVVNTGNENVVQLQIEITSEDVVDGMIENPFNKEV